MSNTARHLESLYIDFLLSCRRKGEHSSITFGLSSRSLHSRCEQLFVSTYKEWLTRDPASSSGFWRSIYQKGWWGRLACLVLRYSWRHGPLHLEPPKEHPPPLLGRLQPLISTHQQGKAVLRQHPILLHELLPGHAGQLGKLLPELVDVDHLLWVCASGQGLRVVEQQRGQVGLRHEPGTQRRWHDWVFGLAGRNKPIVSMKVCVWMPCYLQIFSNIP